MTYQDRKLYLVIDYILWDWLIELTEYQIKRMSHTIKIILYTYIYVKICNLFNMYSKGL